MWAPLVPWAPLYKEHQGDRSPRGPWAHFLPIANGSILPLPREPLTGSSRTAPGALVKSYAEGKIHIIG